MWQTVQNIELLINLFEEVAAEFGWYSEAMTWGLTRAGIRKKSEASEEVAIEVCTEGGGVEKQYRRSS